MPILRARSDPAAGISREEAPTTVVKRLSWLWILVVGVLLFELVRRALIVTGDPNYLPALILLGAAVVPVSFVTFVFERRLAYDVSPGLLVLVALVGGVVGVVSAGLVEYQTLRELGALPMAAVAVIEEAAKLLAPAAVLFFTRHRRPADGLLLGVAAGAGFAILETMGYAFIVLIQSHGDLAAVDGTLLLRGVLSPAAHMAWTGLTAAALWRVVDPRGRHAVLKFLGVFVIAVALHTGWDSISSTLSYGLLAVISLVLLYSTVHGLHRSAVAPASPKFKPLLSTLTGR
jgi:RsiW-degrading membrane proteinase PrsW (M82 family)